MTALLESALASAHMQFGTELDREDAGRVGACCRLVPIRRAGVDFIFGRSCKPAWKWKVHDGVGGGAAVGRLGRAACGQPNLGAQPSLDLSVPRLREHPSHTSTFALAYQPRGEHALTR